MKALKVETRNTEERRLKREGEMRLHSIVSLKSLSDIWTSDFSFRAVGRHWTLYFIFSKTFNESLITQLEKWAYYITPWIFTSEFFTPVWPPPRWRNRTPSATQKFPFIFLFSQSCPLPTTKDNSHLTSYCRIDFLSPVLYFV